MSNRDWNMERTVSGITSALKRARAGECSIMVIEQEAPTDAFRLCCTCGPAGYLYPEPTGQSGKAGHIYVCDDCGARFLVTAICVAEGCAPGGHDAIDAVVGDRAGVEYCVPKTGKWVPANQIPQSAE